MMDLFVTHYDHIKMLALYLYPKINNLYEIRETGLCLNRTSLSDNTIRPVVADISQCRFKTNSNSRISR